LFLQAGEGGQSAGATINRFFFDISSAPRRVSQRRERGDQTATSWTTADRWLLSWVRIAIELNVGHRRDLAVERNGRFESN